MTKILVVDDEPSYRETLTYQLTREGFTVITAASGTEAVEAFGSDIEFVLLDLMLPGLSGTEVAKKIRETSDVPIIMVTAKDSEIDKVVGLELGADDYVTKPYSFRELLARIRAVLRRRPTAVVSNAHDEGPDDDAITLGPLTLDADGHTVTIDGEPIAMPLKEFDLLEYLMRNSGRVLTRGQIIDRIWGSGYVGDTKTLDVHIKRLRSKIEPDPANPRYILTVRGLGYKAMDH
jgi:two-component system response regulator RegX3